MHASTSSQLNLGRIGVFSFEAVTAPAAATRAATAIIDELGFGALWFPEVAAGREALSSAALLLEWTRRLTIATGIATVYARDAVAAANGARGLGDAHPGRFVLGLGVSHRPSVAARGSEYRSPIEAMSQYLDRVDAVSASREEARSPRVLAALGPRMLELAGLRADGALTYFVPVAHTPTARERLGDDATLVVEQAVVLEREPDAAREIARAHTARYLSLDNYRNNLIRLGYGEHELRDGGTDEVVDALVAWGEPQLIAERVHAHLEGGADHVCVQVLRGQSSGFPLTELEVLAPRLLAL